MIVVDTNVVAELMRPEPDGAVLGWAMAQAPGDLYTTAVALAEILYGVERLPAGSRRERLRAAAAEVFTTFAEQVLPFDASAAAQYAVVVETRDRLGLPIGGFDAQIAAICRAAGMAIGTRNVKDFEHTGIRIVNPWDA